MADTPINSGASSFGSSGLNSLLTFLSDTFVQAGRNWGGPKRFLMDVSSDIATRGQTVNVRVAPTVTSRLLTDGDAKVKDDDTGTSTAVTLNKHRYSAFSRTLVAGALEGNASDAMILQSRVTSVLNGIEEDILSTATSGFTANTAQGSYNTDLTEAVIVNAVSLILDQKVPPGPLTGLIHSDDSAWGALTQLAEFSDADVRGTPGAAMQESYGQGLLWHNVRWYLTQALPRSGTSVDNLILHPGALACAMRPISQPMAPGVQAINTVDQASGLAFQILFQWDGDRLADEFVVHALYGYSVVKDEWGIQLKA